LLQHPFLQWRQELRAKHVGDFWLGWKLERFCHLIYTFGHSFLVDIAESVLLHVRRQHEFSINNVETFRLNSFVDCSISLLDRRNSCGWRSNDIAYRLCDRPVKGFY